jgi:hypothetical protein
MIGLTIHYAPLARLTLSALLADGPQAVWAMPNQYPDVQYSNAPYPTPPIRNLLFKSTPHGVIDTGPLPPLGNNLIKAGITAYSNGFLSKSCVKVGSTGVGCVIWGGRGV